MKTFPSPFLSFASCSIMCHWEKRSSYSITAVFKNLKTTVHVLTYNITYILYLFTILCLLRTSCEIRTSNLNVVCIYIFLYQCERTRADQHVCGSKWTECSRSVYSSPECTALCDLLWWAGLTSTKQGEEWGLRWCHGSVSHELMNTFFGQKRLNDSAVCRQRCCLRTNRPLHSLLWFSREDFFPEVIILREESNVKSIMR